MAKASSPRIAPPMASCACFRSLSASFKESCLAAGVVAAAVAAAAAVGGFVDVLVVVLLFRLLLLLRLLLLFLHCAGWLPPPPPRWCRMDVAPRPRIRRRRYMPGGWTHCVCMYVNVCV